MLIAAIEPSGDDHAALVIRGLAIGTLHRFGRSAGEGVLRDYNTAVFWWDKSARQGNHRAQNNLAFAYARGEGVESRDLKKAFKLWEASAEQGNLVAQNFLALCYYTGDGVAKDPIKAVAIWTSAAEHGSRDAQRHLGIAYYTGNGINKDYKKALALFTRAAQAGDEEAAKLADEVNLLISNKEKSKFDY